MGHAFPGRDEIVAGRRSVGVNLASHLLANDPFQCHASFEKTFSSTHYTEFRPDLNGMIQWHDTTSMIIGFNGRKEHFVNGTAGPALLAQIDRHHLVLIEYRAASTSILTLPAVDRSARFRPKHSRATLWHFIELAPTNGNLEFCFSPQIRTVSSSLFIVEVLDSYPLPSNFGTSDSQSMPKTVVFHRETDLKSLCAIHILS